jgi:hypothetical protein
MLSVRKWLSSPQRTNRQAIVVGVLSSLVAAALLYGAGVVLDLVHVFDFSGDAPLWALALAAGTALGGGFVLGRATLAASEREARAYDSYAVHLGDAMADMRRALAGELPDFQWRDFIETAFSSQPSDF